MHACVRALALTAIVCPNRGATPLARRHDLHSYLIPVCTNHDVTRDPEAYRTVSHNQPLTALTGNKEVYRWIGVSLIVERVFLSQSRDKKKRFLHAILNNNNIKNLYFRPHM